MVQVGMSDEEGTFYVGSRILQRYADACGLPMDQFNFLVCMLFGIGFGFFFRDYMSPKTTSPVKRHLVELVVGLILTHFCFGYQVWHMVALASVCYLVMLYGPRHMIHKIVMVVSMGPMMIMVQKTTSIAFALHDGESVPEEKLSADQKSQMLKRCPNVLYYFSYIFCFHGVMVGPTSFYNDYIKFVEGTDIYTSDKQDNNVQGNNNLSSVELVINKYLIAALKRPVKGVCVLARGTTNNKGRGELSSTGAFAENGLIALVCGIVMITSPIYVPPSRMADEDFINNTSMFYRILYVLVCVTLVRGKYYFAWKLGETVNNAAGFGFNGYDKDGKAKWDLLTNVDIYTLETCTSLKVNIDSWNKLTLVWLRRVVYDRAPFLNTYAVFALSCMWHGFYPGYYLCFGTALVLTMAARQVRRHIRPYFLKTPQLKFFYDCVTFAFTRYANVYICSNHVLLTFMAGFNLMKSQYFSLQVLSIAVIILFTFVKPSSPQKKTEKTQ